jgi:protein phosphatase
VSQFVASNFIKLLTNMKSYKLKKYEQALIETYLKFDELLRMEKVNQLLIKQYNNTKSHNNNNNYEINFQLQKDNKDYEKFESAKERLTAINSNNYNAIDKTYLRKSFLMENPVDDIHYDNSNATRRKDLNLTANILSSENLSPNYNYVDDLVRARNSLIKNKKETEKEISLNSADDQKIEISLNKNSADAINTDNFSKLVAKDMGTTANILLIKNNMLYLANVGDSMAVLFKNGQAIRLNQEHKTTLQSEYTRVTKSGAKIMNNRIEGRLNLTRAIGMILIFKFFNLGDLSFKINPDFNIYEQAVTAYPQITTMKITKDCDFIIMACDGVWDCVDAQKLCEHVSIRLKSYAKIADIIADLFDSIISKTNNSKIIQIKINFQPL